MDELARIDHNFRIDVDALKSWFEDAKEAGKADIQERFSKFLDDLAPSYGGTNDNDYDFDGVPDPDSCRM